MPPVEILEAQDITMHVGGDTATVWAVLARRMGLSLDEAALVVAVYGGVLLASEMGLVIKEPLAAPLSPAQVREMMRPLIERWACPPHSEASTP